MIALIGGALFAGVTCTSTAWRIVRLLVGMLMIALGLIQLGRLPVSLRRFEPRWVADALADFEVERMGVIGGEVMVSRALADMLEPGHH